MTRLDLQLASAYVCPACGRLPHLNAVRQAQAYFADVPEQIEWVTRVREFSATACQPNPDPLRPDEDPRVPRHEPQPARSFLGCRWWVALAVTIAIAVLLIAAPRGATNDATGREGSALHDGGPASSLLGAPHDAGTRRGAPQPAVPSGASEPIASTPAPTPTPEPTGAVSGSYTATATWCAPTPTQCQSWGGDAKLAAVNSFTWGDEPYLVRVWRGEASVVVRVVSFCACLGSDRAIDLSPSAFRRLASLGRGRINVIVEDLSGVGLPPTEVVE